MESFKKINLVKYTIFSDKLEKISPKGKITINTLNQYAYCLAEKDSQFRQALEKCDILLPDGFLIVRAVRFLHGRHVTKISGFDMHTYLLEQLNKSGGSCFYLGSSENTLAKIKERMARQYPAIRVNAFSPPYKKEFSAEDNEAMINAVNRYQPDVLFIGLTAPKQEKWAFRNKPRLQANIICSVGAVFDYYAGTIKRANKFWVKHNLEWLIRLIRQPKRTWKRYLIYGPVFIWYIFIKKIKMSSSKSSPGGKNKVINIEAGSPLE